MTNLNEHPSLRESELFNEIISSRNQLEIDVSEFLRKSCNITDNDIMDYCINGMCKLSVEDLELLSYEGVKTLIKSSITEYSAQHTTHSTMKNLM